MKSFKKLLVPIILLLVIVIALIVVLVVRNRKQPGEDSVATGEGTYTVELCDIEDIVSLRVDRTSGDPLIVNSFTNSEGETDFVLDGSQDDGVTYSQDKFDAFLKALISYGLTNKIDSKELNYDDFGLANPEYKVTVSLKNGETKTAAFGSLLSTDSTKCYVMFDGDSYIYVVSTFKRSFCEYKSIDFYDTVDVSIDFKELDNVRFIRKSDNTDIKCVISKFEDTGVPSFAIVEPYEIDVGMGDITTLLRHFGALKIPSLVDLSDEEIEEYGLDDPEYQFIYTMNNGETFEISLSKATNGLHYGMSNRLDNEFVISTQEIEKLGSPLLDILNGYVYRFYVSDVLSVECSYDDITFEYTFDTEDSIASDKAKILLDGRNAKIFNNNGRCYAEVLFFAVSCINIGGFDLDSTPVLDNPVLTLKVIDKTYKVTYIAFVPKDTASYYVFINDKYAGYYVYSSELYNDGGTDIFNYGIVPAYELLTKAISNNINGIYEMESGDN